MKHPFHTLFYIGLSIILLILSFLTLIFINIKDFLPSVSIENRKNVTREYVSNSNTDKIFNQPIIGIKPVEEVIKNETPKIIQQPLTKTEKILIDTLSHKTSDTTSHLKTNTEQEVIDSSESRSELYI